MKTTDIKPLMTFSAVDISSLYFVVDEVDHQKGVARGRAWGCFGPMSNSEEELKRLADEKVFALCVQDTIGTMAEKIRFLESGLKLQAEFMTRHREDLKRVKLYVDDAALGEHGYIEPEGKLCSDLLEKAIHPDFRDIKINPDGTISLEEGVKDIARKITDWFNKHTNVTTPGPTAPPERTIYVRVKELDGSARTQWLKHGDGIEGLNVVDIDLSTMCQHSCSWCGALERRCLSRGGSVHKDRRSWPVEPPAAVRSPAIVRAEKAQPFTAKVRTSDDPEKDPLAEISAVLWFMASLTCDHEPLCGIKASGPCDCDKYVPDDDPWYVRIRKSLQLVSKLQLEQTKKAILSCNGCGDPLKQGETMVCKQCGEIIDLRSRRRSLQLKPMPGQPGPNGNGTVYEVEVPDGVVRLVVLRAERGTVSPEEYVAMRKLYTKLFKGTVGVALICPGDELTLLEVPR